MPQAVPAAPVFTGVDGSTLLNGTLYTNNTTPTVLGTAEAGSTVTMFADLDGNGVYDSGIDFLAGMVTAAGDGTWSVTLPTMTPGSYPAAKAFATNAGGNSTLGVGLPLVIDTTAPTLAIVDDAAGSITNIADGDVAYTFTFSEAVTGFDFSDIAITNGSAVVADFSGSGDTYTLVLTPNPGVQGNLTVSVASGAAFDLAGNAVGTTQLVKLLDTSAPSAPAFTGVDGATLASNILYTSDNTPTIRGTAEAGSTVTMFVDVNSNGVFDGGDVQTGTVTAGGDGTWSVALSALAAGSYPAASAIATDAAGNVSLAGVGLPLVVDTTAPAAPAFTGVDGATLASNILYTNDNTPTIRGTAEAGSTITMFVDVNGNGSLDGADLTTGTATAGNDGNWSITLSAPLTDGSYPAASAFATDSAGNVSLVGVGLPLVVDTITAAPIFTGVDGANLVNGTLYTGDTTPTVRGMAEAGSTITMFVDANGNGSLDAGDITTGTATTGSDGRWSITLLELPASSTPYPAASAIARDVTGNISTIAVGLPLVITEAVSVGDNGKSVGGDGDELLSGAGGGDSGDKMEGGDGNDTYVVDNKKDKVTEGAGDNSGIDLVLSSVDYKLGKNLENLTLTGAVDQNLKGTGNELDNILTGDDGDNMLDGGTGVDTFFGGGGNDTFILDDLLETVTEYTGEGDSDTIKLKVNTLSPDADNNYQMDDYVENLEITGAAEINVAGNDGNNSIKGNAKANSLEGLAGNDTLDGGKGADTLDGGTGDDTYYVDTGDKFNAAGELTVTGDTVIENDNGGTDTVFSSAASYILADNVESLALIKTGGKGTGNDGDNTIAGNDKANTLDGAAGADTLDGGKGKDILIGGDGADIFVFSTDLGKSNVDSLYDFASGIDKIELDSNIFDMLTAGTLDAGNFLSVDGIKTLRIDQDDNDFIVFDTKTGALYYDADANGAGSKAVQFAVVKLAGVTDFTGLVVATDIQIA